MGGQGDWFLLLGKRQARECFSIIDFYKETGGSFSAAMLRVSVIQQQTAAFCPVKKRRKNPPLMRATQQGSKAAKSVSGTTSASLSSLGSHKDCHRSSAWHLSHQSDFAVLRSCCATFVSLFRLRGSSAGGTAQGACGPLKKPRGLQSCPAGNCLALRMVTGRQSFLTSARSAPTPASRICAAARSRRPPPGGNLHCHPVQSLLPECRIQ